MSLLFNGDLESDIYGGLHFYVNQSTMNDPANTELEFSSSVQNLLKAIDNKESDFLKFVALVSKPLTYFHLPLENLHFQQSLFRQIPRLQHVILTQVAPVWEDTFTENGNLDVLKAYFYPLTFHGLMAVQAYTSITAVPFDEFSLRILVHLRKEFDLDCCFHAISGPHFLARHVKTALWEECTRSTMSIPTRLANQKLLEKVDSCLLPE